MYFSKDRNNYRNSTGNLAEIFAQSISIIKGPSGADKETSARRFMLLLLTNYYSIEIEGSKYIWNCVLHFVTLVIISKLIRLIIMKTRKVVLKVIFGIFLLLSTLSIDSCKKCWTCSDTSGSITYRTRFTCNESKKNSYVSMGWDCQ